jgi:two-component system KDP operon response regulator KdpE
MTPLDENREVSCYQVDKYPMNALLVAQDSDEAAVLTVVLRRAGFGVRLLQELDRLIPSWKDQSSELILISLRHGYPANKLSSQINALRAHSEVPIIVIGSFSDEDVQINLLDNGADLCFSRPYSVRMLIAMLRALLRRVREAPSFRPVELNVNGVVLDPVTHTVRIREAAPIHLTQLEYRLLYTFMLHPGQVIPTVNLVENVWGFNGQGGRDLVRGLVRRLRYKIENRPAEPEYIHSIPGVGYVFSPS